MGVRVPAAPTVQGRIPRRRHRREESKGSPRGSHGARGEAPGLAGGRPTGAAGPHGGRRESLDLGKGPRLFWKLVPLRTRARHRLAPPARADRTGLPAAGSRPLGGVPGPSRWALLPPVRRAHPSGPAAADLPSRASLPPLALVRRLRLGGSGAPTPPTPPRRAIPLAPTPPGPLPRLPLAGRRGGARGGSGRPRPGDGLDARAWRERVRRQRGPTPASTPLGLPLEGSRPGLGRRVPLGRGGGEAGATAPEPGRGPGPAHPLAQEARRPRVPLEGSGLTRGESASRVSTARRATGFRPPLPPTAPVSRS